MFAQAILKARQNRILALRTVAARNSESSYADHANPIAHKENSAPRLELVSTKAASPWQPDDDRYAA